MSASPASVDRQELPVVAVHDHDAAASPSGRDGITFSDALDDAARPSRVRHAPHGEVALDARHAVGRAPRLGAR